MTDIFGKAYRDALRQQRMIDEAMALGTLGTIGNTGRLVKDALTARDLYTEATGMGLKGKLGIAAGAFTASQQARNDAIASSMPNTLGIGRGLSELFSRTVSGVGLAAEGRNSSVNEALRAAREYANTTIGRALADEYRDRISMQASGKPPGLASINEALGLTLRKYETSIGIASEVGKLMASQQREFIDTINGFSVSQSIKAAKVLEAFDVGDWNDFDFDLENEDQVDEFRSKIIEVFVYLLTLLQTPNVTFDRCLALLSLALTLTASSFTETDRMNAAVTKHEATAAHAAASMAAKGIEEFREGVAAEEAYLEQVSALPKGTVINRGKVRSLPTKSSAQVALLVRDDTVAIAERKGKWLCIFYSDPLTKNLEQGWIWGGSVDSFSE